MQGLRDHTLRYVFVAGLLAQVKQLLHMSFRIDMLSIDQMHTWVIIKDNTLEPTPIVAVATQVTD